MPQEEKEKPMFMQWTQPPVSRRNMVRYADDVITPAADVLDDGESYQVIPITPHLDFSSDQGFDRAVEMCNGAGICRKRTTGTMCPGCTKWDPAMRSFPDAAARPKAAWPETPYAEYELGKDRYDCVDG